MNEIKEKIEQSKIENLKDSDVEIQKQKYCNSEHQKFNKAGLQNIVSNMQIAEIGNS